MNKMAMRFVFFIGLILLYNFANNNLSSQQNLDIMSSQFPSQNAETWLQTQFNSSLSDETKIKSTIDTYFKLKYESLISQKFNEFYFLFNPQNSTAQELSNYEKSLLTVMIFAWNLHGINIIRYDYMPKYYDISIKGKIASVSMWPNADIVHVDTPERIDCTPWTSHSLTLVCQDGCWYIQKDHTDDEWHLLYPQDTDFREEISSLPKKIRESDEEQRNIYEKLRLNPNFSSRYKRKTQSSNIPLGYRLYDRYKCTYYASIYSSNEPGSGSYNPLFIDCSNLGGDCTNYVSQCIWYGYGGTNESGPIENHDLPMIDDDILATTWWCDSEGYGVSPNGMKCWINANNFNYMATQNYNNFRVGLQATKGGCYATLEGDYIKCKTISHIYIVSHIFDYDNDGMTDYNEIYVCSHTTNHKNKRLVDLWPNVGSVYFMWIMGFKNPD